MNESVDARVVARVAHELRNGLSVLAAEHTFLDDELKELALDDGTRRELARALASCARQLTRCAACCRELEATAGGES